MRHYFRQSLRIVSGLSLALAACSDKTAKPDTSTAAPPAVPAPPAGGTPIESTTFAPALTVDLGTSTKTPQGLYYKDRTVGTGAEAVAGKLLSVKYAGRLPDGTPFDAGTYEFHIGAREAIEGWDVGIAGMKAGGKRQLIVPYTLGYGADGRGPIPPYGIMVFEVELLSVK